MKTFLLLAALLVVVLAEDTKNCSDIATKEECDKNGDCKWEVPEGGATTAAPGAPTAAPEAPPKKAETPPKKPAARRKRFADFDDFPISRFTRDADGGKCVNGSNKAATSFKLLAALLTLTAISKFL